MEQSNCDSQHKSNVEIVKGYSKTHIKKNQFTYTWEIPKFETLFEMPQHLREVRSSKFSINYKKTLIMWNLILKELLCYKELYCSRPYYSLSLDLIFGTETKIETENNYAVCIEISVIDNQDQNYKMLTSDLLTKVTEVHANIGKSSDIRKDYLKNGSLRIEIKIDFIEQQFECWSGLIQVAQGIAEHRLKEFDDFERILEDTTFSDVKILVDDQQFCVHKIILASRSSVFAAMFEHNMKENIESEIKIDDISHNVMKEVLRFIYAGKVNNIQDLACDLFVAADKYNLQGLKDLCDDVLVNKLSINNICDMLTLVDHYKTNRLESAAIKFVHINAAQLIFRKEFNSTMNFLSKKLYKSLKKTALD